MDAGARLESDTCIIDELLERSLHYFSQRGRFLEPETLEAMMNGLGAVAQTLLKAYLKMDIVNKAHFGNLLMPASYGCLSMLEQTLTALALKNGWLHLS